MLHFSEVYRLHKQSYRQTHDNENSLSHVVADGMENQWPRGFVMKICLNLLERRNGKLSGD